MSNMSILQLCLSSFFWLSDHILCLPHLICINSCSPDDTTAGVVVGEIILFQWSQMLGKVSRNVSNPLTRLTHWHIMPVPHTHVQINDRPAHEMRHFYQPVVAHTKVPRLCKKEPAFGIGYIRMRKKGTQGRNAAWRLMIGKFCCVVWDITMQLPSRHKNVSCTKGKWLVGMTTAPSQSLKSDGSNYQCLVKCALMLTQARTRTHTYTYEESHKSDS